MTYNVTDSSGNAASEVTRTVNVTDTTTPVITLVGDAEITVEVGTTYTDLGATASDNYDGDITADIVTVNNVDTSVIGSYTVTYNVTDSSGNDATEVTRTVNVTDTTAPVITLVGDAVVDLSVGDTYTEEGATATDNVDGDISANIVIGGDTVDTNTAGQYIVTYNVSDAAGNAAAEATRTVNVNEVVDPCANANASAQPAADFDNDSVDIKEWIEDNATWEIVDGATTVDAAGTDIVGGTGNILKYVDAGGEWYSNIQIRTCSKFDLTVVNKFTMDVYIDSGSLSGNSPNQLEFKLQDATTNSMNPWDNQSSIIAAVDQLDTWVTVEFDFSTKTDGTLDRTDFDNIVLQFNGEGQANNNPVTAYIDNIASSYNNPLTTIDRNLGALRVFPNPTQNQWTIQAEKNIESLRVFDVSGKEVMHVKPFSNAINIDATKLRDGVYFARINNVKTVRIIKE